MARFSLVLNSLAVKYRPAFNKAQHLNALGTSRKSGSAALHAVKLSALH